MRVPSERKRPIINASYTGFLVLTTGWITIAKVVENPSNGSVRNVVQIYAATWFLLVLCKKRIEKSRFSGGNIPRSMHVNQARFVFRKDCSLVDILK